LQRLDHPGGGNATVFDFDAVRLFDQLFESQGLPWYYK